MKSFQPPKIGDSIPRIDALPKVLGKPEFCSDFKLPGMLYGKVVRSPYGHARILSIDTSQAKQVPGVRAVITGDDVPARRSGMVRFAFDQFVLARGESLFAGEGVAAVAADTEDIAEEAADLIKIDYQELPGMYDLEQAFDTKPAAVVHPGLPGYEQPMASVRLEPSRPNVCNHFKVRHGDTARGFAEADYIIENRFTTSRVQQAALERPACIVKVDDEGATIWDGLQGVFGTRAFICRTFDLPPSRVRVISSFSVGGAFGSKFMAPLEPIAFVLSRKAGKPVRLDMSRSEMFSTGGNRIPCIIDIKDGVKKDGRIVAREMRFLVNTGAYASWGGTQLTKNMIFGTTASYNIPNFWLDSYGVYTNEPPVCAMRGFATEQCLWAIESQMDMLAEKIGMNPAEIRLNNVLKEGDISCLGEKTHSIGAVECLKKVVECLKPADKPAVEGPWRRGKGFALGNRYGWGGGVSTCLVKVLEDGAVEARFTADELGQGIKTVVAQIVASEFGISTDMVRLIWNDSFIAPFSNQTLAQGTTFIVGNSVMLACRDAKKQLFDIAAKKLGIPSAELETGNAMVYSRLTPAKSITIKELAKKGFFEPGGELVGRGFWSETAAPDNPETGQVPPELTEKGMKLAGFYTHIAQGFEVAVNTETGDIKIEKCVAVTDVVPVNPKMCEQQMEGGLNMGAGTTLWEAIRLNDGKILNADFRDYKLSTAASLPPIKEISTFLAPTPHKDGPYGAKGLGEAVLAPSAPAIANAVYNATGVRIKDLPLSPERVLSALKKLEK